MQENMTEQEIRQDEVAEEDMQVTPKAEAAEAEPTDESGKKGSDKKRLKKAVLSYIYAFHL